MVPDSVANKNWLSEIICLEISIQVFIERKHMYSSVQDFQVPVIIELATALERFVLMILSPPIAG